MKIWRGPWIWDTTDTLPYWRGPADTRGLIDVRSTRECGIAGGVPGIGLFATDPGNELPSEYDLLGHGDWHEIKVSQRLRDMIPCRKGFVVEGDTLAQLIANAVTDGADPTGQEFTYPFPPGPGMQFGLPLGDMVIHRLVPKASVHWQNCLDMWRVDFNGVFEDSMTGKMNTRHGNGDKEQHLRFLGARCRKYHEPDWTMFVAPEIRKEIDKPKDPETKYTDAFTRSDADALGTSSEGWSWAEVNGDTDIVSNMARFMQNQNVNGSARAEADLSSVDSYSQVSCVALGTISLAGQGRAITRFAAAAETYYFALIQRAGGAADRQTLAKNVATTVTVIAGPTNFTLGLPHTLKVEANSGTIKGYRDGTEIHSVADAAIPGGTRAGLGGVAPQVLEAMDLDTFEAGDLFLRGNLALMGVGV